MADVIQRSLSGGEIAPSLWARADLSKHATSLKTCRNFIIHKHGGASNRSGTSLTIEVKDSTKATRLVPFRYSNTQTYAMEFGENYMRLIKDGGIVVVTDGDAPAYNGATAYVVGDLCTSAGIRYYCIAATTGNAPPNATFWYALTGDIYEIPTPYAEADISGLKFTQSADIITIMHPSHDPMDLSRLGNVTWTLAVVNFGPAILPPTSPAAVAGTAGTTVWRYKIASVSADTGEESEPTAMFSCTGGTPTSAAPNALTWAPAASALQYEVYKEIIPGNGVYGLIGIAIGTAFNDINIVPSAGEQPVTNKTPFAGVGNKPSTAAYYQGRRVYGGTVNNPETVVASKSGLFDSLSISTPLRDDDAVTFSLAGDSVNRVVGLVGLRKLVVLTEAGEWTVEGDGSGILTPSQINPIQQSFNGAADIHPIVVGNEVMYVQARGGAIRNLGYEFASDGYKGDDVTLYATHLFKGKTVVDWTYAQIPDSIIWVCMDDGSLLGLTYIKSQQVWGWHRHDTTANGKVESVCSIPEGNEDVLYMVVNRTINGAQKRYIERMNSRDIQDVVLDSKFMDSSLTYDGTNINPANTMTLTGGVLWDHTEDLTLDSVSSTFVVGDVGNRIVLVSGTTLQKLDIIAYVSATQVTVRSINNVNALFQATAIPDWSKAVDVVTGLDHLEGENVAVLADGNVVANGYDPILLTVTGGSVSLGGLYSIIHVGLPIEADLESLDLDGQDKRTALNKESLVSNVDLMVESSRGVWVGMSADDALTEYKQRSSEDYGELTRLTTGIISVAINSAYNKGGRVFIRQRDPLPLTVLAIIPVGRLGGE